MLDFYTMSERAMLRLFPQARFVFSTQPLVNQFTGNFVDIYSHPLGSDTRKAAIAKREADLESYLRYHENEQCGQKTSHIAQTYILVNGAIRLERMVGEERAIGSRVDYYNIACGLAGCAT